MMVMLLALSPALATDFVRESAPHKWIATFLPEELPELEYPKYFNDLDKARLQQQTGRYKLSLLTLAKAKDADATEVSIIKAKSLSAMGRRDEAISLLVAETPEVQILRAQILAELGKTDESLAQLKKHLAAHPDSLAGHYLLGVVNEQVGDLQSALAAYTWFADDQKFLDKWQGQSPIFDSAENVTIVGRALDRWAAISGAYRENASLHNILLNMFVRAYDVIDRGYTPAHTAAAEYFLSHDDGGEARKEILAALDANPNDLPALRLMALLAIDTFNFDAADQAIKTMREVDRNSIEADLLESRNLMRQRQPKAAQAPVQKVLKKQPKNLEALGLLAATNALQLKDDETARLLKDIEKLDPDNATAYVEVAEQLGAMRQYPRSAEKYRVAIERAPWWTAPRNSLGLLYTQSGDEELARTTLDAAHALDPFNVATTNYLRLLDDMDKFAVSETAHFKVLYDGEVDPVIPEYFGEYLESIYKDVCADFKTEPSVKTYIEVFPTHDAFSVRTTGSPWIGTVGASTGRVIAMVAPRKGTATMGPFNWSSVLRHEFTHTVTLAATDNRIAHWFTEGLAVWEEHSPLRWEWVPMLHHAVTNKKLFTMDRLTWGFVRPKKPSDRQLAYAQSYWICTYIEQKYGHDAILKMLAEFKLGASQDDVFPKILGKSIGEFEKDFFAWTEKEVATWGYDEETAKKYDEKREKAEELLAAKKFDEALVFWQELQKMRPVDALPHTRLAYLYLKLNKQEDAAKELIALHEVELKDNRYAKRIARLYRDMNKLEDGVKYGKQAVYIDPYDRDAHELLASLFEKAGNEEGLSRERRVISVIDEWAKRQQKESSFEQP